MHRVAGVEGNRAEGVEFILHVAVGLRMFDVGQVHDVKSECAKAAVADGAAVFHSLGYGDRAVISGPGGVISGEAIFLVFVFLTQFLSGHPPAGNFLHVGGIGHVHDHERVAVGALVIFEAQGFVPAAIEIGVFSAIVKIVVGAVAFRSGVVFLQQIRLGGIGDVVVADAAEAFVGENFVPQFLVILAVGILGVALVSGCAAVHIMIHFLSLVL